MKLWPLRLAFLLFKLSRGLDASDVSYVSTNVFGHFYISMDLLLVLVNIIICLDVFIYFLKQLLQN
jgi:hypothetical protein